MMGTGGPTRLSKAISALLVIIFAVQYFVPSTTSYLALVPGRTLPCVWNLVTAGFLTTNVFKLVAEVSSVLFLARLVEPLFGSREFLKFLFVVDFSVCFCVFAAVYMIFAFTASGTLLYTEFTGFHGILAALLVAIKQLMPDHEFKIFGFIKFTVKYVPLLFVLAATGIAVGLKSVGSLPFLYLGAYNAWLYLRFFQQQPETQLRGDPSDEFKFSGFFPPLFAPIFDGLGTVFGTIFRLKHGPDAAAAAAASKTLHFSGTPSVLGSDATDANRRRERGAKALEERLGAKTKSQPESDIEKPAVQSTAVSS